MSNRTTVLLTMLILGPTASQATSIDWVHDIPAGFAQAREAINTIRLLAADMVEQAQSGHPGTPMEAAPIAYLLYARHMRHNPANPTCWSMPEDSCKCSPAGR